MEKIVEQGLLYDFYGELLNEHQRRIYEDAVMNDMSLSEIAQEAGISRQGVHDLIKRCDKTLEDYESRLHLIARPRVVNVASSARQEVDLVVSSVCRHDERRIDHVVDRIALLHLMVIELKRVADCHHARRFLRVDVRGRCAPPSNDSREIAVAGLIKDA